MPRSLRIVPYGPSNTARDLANLLDVWRVPDVNKIKPYWWLVNWGNSSTWPNVSHNILNRPISVAIGKNKLKTFMCLKTNGVSTPDWTTDKNVAKAWLVDGFSVVCRASLTGLGGQDIKIIDPPVNNLLDIPTSLLYTKYVKKLEEWRVHIFRGKMISYAKKVKPKEYTGTMGDTRIKSHLNGFLFSKQAGPPRQDIVNEATKAVQACGLDFGGVDIIWNEHLSRAFVLEINTAPGLEGSSLQAYATAIKGWYNHAS